ncbi:TRAP transporter substrate-binding protein [Pseudoalteromonas spongiae]|uniref:TRAP transporter substrate-binding protein n=1 Tax=Pseudoalteromonas spongiae TaxID=298657 RepID=UPI00026CD3CB|nr:TRAP transporter substrate-binding protein DctP [Pseudoalteromonas spongiae]ATD00512.1 hypothetical protein PSPO_b0500 [Pseudoalteromonas spongiae UST010723-006]
MPISRRYFIKSSSALVASSLFQVGYLNAATTLPNADDLAQDNEIKQRSEHTLVFASPYHTSDASFVPHLHIEFKRNIQSLSQGKIYVDIQGQGAMGIGTDLMAAVSRGRIDAALISVANLSRALPLLDILNIPFWAGDDQALLNLISSPYWQQNVIEKIAKQGKLAILYHYITGGRTLSTTKRTNTVIKVPTDLKNKVLRIPASKVLKHFYSMTDAHIVEVNWANVAAMARVGKFHVLDPGIVGLYAGPNNLRDEIATITQLNSVPDTWVNVVSQKWLNTLPRTLRLAVNDAAEKTFLSQLSNVSHIESNCEQEFIKRGCTVFKPDQPTIALWQDQFGHHRHEWRDIKKSLLGSSNEFSRLLDATKTPSKHSLT